MAAPDSSTPHKQKPTEAGIRYWMTNLVGEMQSIQPRTMPQDNSGEITGYNRIVGVVANIVN